MKPLYQKITIPALYLRQNLGKVIHRVVMDKDHFILEKNGIPVLAVIPLEDYQVLQEIENDKATD